MLAHDERLHLGSGLIVGPPLASPKGHRRPCLFVDSGDGHGVPLDLMMQAKHRLVEQQESPSD
jgi:hypothetical protein